MAEPTSTSFAECRRVAIVAPDAASLLRLRRGLMRAILARGHRILALAPDLDPALGFTTASTALATMTVETAGYPLAEGSVQPFADRRGVKRLARVLADWRPHAVIGYGAKPMLLAALAGRRAGATRIVPLVSTLGELAWGPRASPSVALRLMMGSAFAAAHAIVFHNHDDAGRLRAAGLLPRGTPVHVLPGGGVDLDRFHAAPLPASTSGLVFTMIARLEQRKGVLEFCKAARWLRTLAPGTRFRLAGAVGTGGDLVAPEIVAGYGDCVEWLRWVDDVRPLLAETHVFVLPSHGEGMAPALLEALATGRPVITCDAPGCRDTVDACVNGVLVAVRDVPALIAAMDMFIRHPEYLAWMSRASRSKAERRFDARTAEAAWMRILGLAGPADTGERQSGAG